MPKTTAPSLEAGNTETPGGMTNNNYAEPTFPFPTTFIQEAETRSTTNIAIPFDFMDSFLIRGDALSKYLRTLPNSTKFCLVGKYNFISGTDKFLVMSAKPKSFTDLANKTTEFYLQVEPSNDSANQNDCLNYNLTNALFDNASSPSIHFSFSQLCSTCTTTVTSTGLKLYFINGEEVPVVNVSSLLLTLSGTSTSSGNGCSDSSACVARGFDCCLQSQCVNDKTLKPGTSLLPGYDAATEDVRLNPSRVTIYPQFYFICDSRPEVDEDDDETEVDEDYEAAIRLMELKQLYSCLNKVDGEFSHCTIKYTDVTESLPATFSAADEGYLDDINFSGINTNLGTGDYKNNIYKITYGGSTLYEQNVTPLTGVTLSSPNDDLIKSQSATVSATLPANAQDGNLYLTYKVDGTCEKIGSTMARCTKSYIHGSTDNKSTQWHSLTSSTYVLPSYADVSADSSIIVKVSGIIVPYDPLLTWTKSSATNSITFLVTNPIHQNQIVEITYFVKAGYANALTKLRSDTQAKVNTMCSCTASAKCNLKPVMNTENTSIVNYACTYQTTAPTEPPVNQTVYVSSKNIPHRYFDKNGVSYDEDYGSALDQELTAFAYTNNDVLKPNNVTGAAIGFNEIYGSFAKSGSYVAKPAKAVRVKKDKLYDITVQSGVYSSCLTCGSDYYNSLQKIFPQNFTGMGGGYAPDVYESRRQNNASLYRSDDLLFGRACFVPATMIPWTHATGDTTKDQRQSRLAAQHFLFANGYNRDWYGFDYGSLIGSFDGVTWFSVGNQRRIKASTHKLYLAVNSYAGDLNVDSNFNVNVTESTAYSNDLPDHDTETDGAQCQKSHYCSQDNDCFRQLGYDYTCQNVSTLTTKWPQFDSYASETIGSTTKTLLAMVGGSNGQAKRCVYRGRGAPCLSNLDLAATTTTFNGSTSVGHLMCSPNTTCSALSAPLRFNDRISRYANTPVAQNAMPDLPDTDTVGMGARVLLRPFDYYGTKTITPHSSLTSNSVAAICVPGKDLNSATDKFDLHAKFPASTIDAADKILGVGITSSQNMTARALNACPATDAAGISMQLYDVSITNSILSMYSITQNLSSNLLDNTPMKAQNIFSSTNNSQITTVGYQRNTCLRAPGASCFSDMECAPSTLIASKAKVADLTSILNDAEIGFWKEELVCGNPDFKYVSTGVLNPNFDLKKNTCCREFGKTLTVYTQTDTSTHQWCDTTTASVKVAGVNTSISNMSRYSRVHTVYDKMTCDRTQISSTKSFALSLAADTEVNRMTQILGQYKTLDTLNQRTCCTQNWVRSFSSDNGAGHTFAKTKMQNIDKAMFKHISWNADDETTISPAVNDDAFECNSLQYTNASCEIKSLTPTEEEKYLSWASSLELIGIPQVAIKTNDQIYKLVTDNQNAAGANVPLEDSDGKRIFRDSTALADFIDGSGFRYYSGTNYYGLNMTVAASKNQMKKVFSENEFNCCIPSGQEVPTTTTNEQCCTGLKANVNGPSRCCLPDFTNVSVYLNRYVSSEGRGLPDTAYDTTTGYIKDAGQVKLMAAQKNLCCSGNAMTGVAISQLSIPLENGTYRPADTASTTRRFNYRTDAVDNNSETGSVGSLFDAGLRWNNHVYCVPAGFGN